MATMTFDTLQHVEDMKRAGMPEDQAKAQAKAMMKFRDEMNNETVTKDFLAAELEKVRADIHQLENRLVWKVVGVVGLSMALYRLLFM